MSVPAYNISIVNGIRHFIVENLRTARRTLRRWNREFPIDECEFHELNGHTDVREIPSMLDALRAGHPMGIMSEAGCPAIADPGADVVAIAQTEGLRVIPLVGPSSIIMSLMASGFNGQGFAFNGYLPVRDEERLRALRELESRCSRLGQTQIFIETPYRNNKTIEFLSRYLQPDTLLCVASGITEPDCESIKTKPARKWKSNTEDYGHRPAIFLIHRAR
ncbi:MAG: SAM-dependent methyltransferase [Muribaculaceae bacterium]|nr:SAM-dependent methyltransferase [Muribaculaceae bacterium]